MDTILIIDRQTERGKAIAESLIEFINTDQLYFINQNLKLKYYKGKKRFIPIKELPQSFELSFIHYRDEELASRFSYKTDIWYGGNGWEEGKNRRFNIPFMIRNRNDVIRHFRKLQVFELLKWIEEKECYEDSKPGLLMPILNKPILLKLYFLSFGAMSKMIAQDINLKKGTSIDLKHRINKLLEIKIITKEDLQLLKTIDILNSKNFWLWKLDLLDSYGTIDKNKSEVFETSLDEELNNLQNDPLTRLIHALIDDLRAADNYFNNDIIENFYSETVKEYYNQSFANMTSDFEFERHYLSHDILQNQMLFHLEPITEQLNENPDNIKLYESQFRQILDLITKEYHKIELLINSIDEELLPANDSPFIQMEVDAHAEMITKLINMDWYIYKSVSQIKKDAHSHSSNVRNRMGPIFNFFQKNDYITAGVNFDIIYSLIGLRDDLSSLFDSLHQIHSLEVV